MWLNLENNELEDMERAMLELSTRLRAYLSEPHYPESLTVAAKQQLDRVDAMRKRIQFFSEESFGQQPCNFCGGPDKLSSDGFKLQSIKADNKKKNYLLYDNDAIPDLKMGLGCMAVTHCPLCGRKLDF